MAGNRKKSPQAHNKPNRDAPGKPSGQTGAASPAHEEKASGLSDDGSLGKLGGVLDNLLSIADEGEKRPQGEGGGDSAGAGMEPAGEGVVELLSALRADIESLREENERFRQQLLHVSATTSGDQPGDGHGGPQASRENGDKDIRELLAALKSDIESLRQENDQLRSQAFAAPASKMAGGTSQADAELYAMLAELKSDIVALREENEALRQRNNISRPVPAAGGHGGEIGALLAELRRDIDRLNKENESLRIENRAAFDARHAHDSDDYDPYQPEHEWELTGLAKFLGILILIGGAAAGGYYFAHLQDSVPYPGHIASQNREEPARPPENLPSTAIAPSAISKKAPAMASSYPKVPVAPSTPALPSQTKESQAKEGAANAPSLPITSPLAVPSGQKGAAEKGAGMASSGRFFAPPAKTSPETAPEKALDPAIEKAMMKQADKLLASRDISALRLIYVYLARKGSAQAMGKLAETYDLRFLRRHGLDALEFGDPARARRLYAVASSMGDQRAARLLASMP